jgi:hypothetical protein
MIPESAKWKATLIITKFKDADSIVEAASRVGASSEMLRQRFSQHFLGQEVHEGNMLVYLGITGIWKLIAGLSSPPAVWNNAGAKIRVGTGSGAAAKADTLATFTSPVDKGMDASYPQTIGTNNDTCSWKATYGSGDANQAWNEFGVINSDGTPVLLNRFVTSKGTKASGETWTCEIQIQLS